MPFQIFASENPSKDSLSKFSSTKIRPKIVFPNFRQRKSVQRCSFQNFVNQNNVQRFPFQDFEKWRKIVFPNALAVVSTQIRPKMGQHKTGSTFVKDFQKTIIRINDTDIKYLRGNGTYILLLALRSCFRLFCLVCALVGMGSWQQVLGQALNALTIGGNTKS